MYPSTGQDLGQLHPDCLDELTVVTYVLLKSVEKQELVAHQRLKRLTDQTLTRELDLGVQLIEEPLLRLVLQEAPLEEVA